MQSVGGSTMARGITRRILSVLLHLPMIGSLLKRSFSCVYLYLVLLHQKRDYSTLYKLICELLEAKRFQRPEQQKVWWFLMRMQVAFMQEQQINQLIIHPELEERLIRLGQQGPGEKIGHNVAYSFIGYSLWMFERANIHQALELAQVAAYADTNWGYPEYLLGWYGLFLGKSDTEQHFVQAVKLDWNFLHRMRRDRTCQQYPELIKKVSQNVVIQTARQGQS